MRPNIDEILSSSDFNFSSDDELKIVPSTFNLKRKLLRAWIIGGLCGAIAGFVIGAMLSGAGR